MRLVLASASPARLAVLRAAGVDPVVRVSAVDEDALARRLAGATPAQLVTALAQAKADAVAAGIGVEHPDTVVVGCDSMLHIGGELVGKPGRPDVALRRWQAMAGGTGELLTGHAVVRLDQGAPAGGLRGAAVRRSEGFDFSTLLHLFTCSTCHTVDVKRNLTVQLDEDLIRRAKVVAAERGTSVSGLVTQQITELIEARDRYIGARESALGMMSAATDRGGRRWTREELYGQRLDRYGA